MLGPAMTGNPCRLHPAQMLSRNGPRIAFEESNYRNQSRPEAASAIGETGRHFVGRRLCIHWPAAPPARPLVSAAHRLGSRRPDPARLARAAIPLERTSFRLRRNRRLHRPGPAGLLALRLPVLAVRPGQRARIRPPMLDQPVRRTRGLRHRPPPSYGQRGARPRHPYPGSLTLRAVQDANRAGKPAADHHPTCPAIARSERRSQS